MPPQQRDTLYIKDDDYCFSFIFGNFITLTNLTERDYEKILEQRLSPLYISVHTTNPALHKKMIGYSMDFNIMKQLRYLRDNGIEFHTQIVVVPGYNDGKELERTLHDLDSLGENCLSIGIVPVGLTKYRQGFPELRIVNEAEAVSLLNCSAKYRRTWCSDEIYLKAGEPIPAAEFYEDYPQLENGIGMVRMFIDNWQDNYPEFLPWLIDMGKKFVFISGVLIAPVLEDIYRFVEEEEPGLVRMQAVQNHFMGETVTVTGLLTWQDIRAQLVLAEGEVAVFCSNTFNTDGYTLDGMHMNDMAAELGGEIIIISEEFTFWEVIRD
jgi:putative radical SAM enzyme (TIGR03279 family)